MTVKREGFSIQLTERCNLACRYCYVMAREHRDTEDCTPELCERFVDFALRESGDEVKVTFFGGEPLLRADLIRHTVARGRQAAGDRGKVIRFHLVTNGILLDDAVGDFLAKEQVSLEISLDGPEELHDRHRVYPDGSGSFRSVYGNLMRFVDRHPNHPLGIFSVLTSTESLPWLQALTRSLGTAGLSLNPLHPVGKTKHSPQTASVRRTLDRDLRRRAAAVLGGHAEIDEALRVEVAAHLGQVVSHRCEAGINATIVTRSGDIYPCPLFVGCEDQVIGDIRRGFRPGRVKPYLRRNLRMPPDCRKCEAMPLCGGGCAFVSRRRGDIPGSPGRDDCSAARRHARELEPSAIRLASRSPELLLEKTVGRPGPQPPEDQHSRRVTDPHSFVVRLTGRCNLACDYCYDWKKEAPEAAMQRSTARSVVSYILRSSAPTPTVCLFGGECLLNWETGRFVIEEVAKKAPALGKRPFFTIVTNGTLLSREIAGDLARHDVTVQVSLDGGRVGHDRYRHYPDGRGSYDDILRGLENLRAAWPDARVDAKVVLTPENLDMKKIVIKLKALGIRRISFVASAWGESTGVEWPLPDIRNLMKAREAFFPFFLESAIRGRADIDMRLAGLISAEPEGPRAGCECGAGEVHIDAAGEIHLCPQLYAARRGRLGECSSAGRRTEHLALPAGEPAGTDCLECWARPRCGGGCMALNHRCPWNASSLPPEEREAWCDLMRAEFARGILAHRLLQARHPRSLQTISSIFQA